MNSDRLPNIEWRPIYQDLLRFVTPYRRLLLIVAATALLVGIMMSVRPLIFAPALDVFLPTNSDSASNFQELNLNNIGPTIASILHLNTEDVVSVGVIVAIIFLGFTVAIFVLQKLVTRDSKDKLGNSLAK